MKRILSVGMAGLLLAIAGAALAYPSLLGPTGGTNLPTANVIGEGKFDFAFDWFNQKVKETYDVGGTPVEFKTNAAKVFRVLYGFAPNLEGGLGYTSQKLTAEGGGDYESISLDNWNLNIKYLTPLTLGEAAWSVGAVYEKFKEDLGKTWQIYFVGTKVFQPATDLSPGVRGSLGVNYSKSQNGESVSAVRPFVAIDLAFRKGLSFTAEYQLKDSDFDEKALMSVALRYPFTPELTGQIGFSNGFRGVSGSDKYDLLVGVKYTFTSMMR